MTMLCPGCKSPMKEGMLKLIIGGSGFGLFSEATASLRFNQVRIVEIVKETFFGGSKKYTAFRCEACAIISFKYGGHS